MSMDGVPAFRIALLSARRASRVAALLCAVLFGGVAACAGDEDEGNADVLSDPTPDTHLAFLENLAVPCGEAFLGRLVLTPEGDGMLTGTEDLLVHFRDCEADEVRIPFHVEVEATETWDRSRTWYVMAVDGGIELRHDHREPDGSESTRTWYGGFSVGPGSATRQDFASPERTERAGVPVGWRIEIEPGRHYRYGTTYDGEYDWMIEFDLSAPLAGEIPGAWGWESPPSRIPGPP